MLINETKILEYWRRKYLLEAFIVLLIGIGTAVVTEIYADYVWSKVLFLLLAIVVSYVMIKEIKNDLQARGEALILAHGNELFGHIQFNFGRGLTESELAQFEVIKNYTTRECQTVMKVSGAVIEEDWFYSVVSAKLLALTQTAFRGIVIAFDEPKQQQIYKGEVLLRGDKAVLKGAIKQIFSKDGIEAQFKQLLQLLKAKTMQVVAGNGKVYFFIYTDDTIFYQFSLIKQITIKAFVSRINQLEESVKNFRKSL